MEECSQEACGELATWYPAFVVAFHDGRPARRIAVPLVVCDLHAGLIGLALDSPERREALRARCGVSGEAIDWDGCRVEFVRAGARDALTGPAGWLA